VAGGRGAVLLVALVGVAGGASACAHTCNVTGWFKVERREPILDEPVEIGPHDHRAFAYTGAGWRLLDTTRWDSPIEAVALAGDASVLLRAEPRDGWQILERGAEHPRGLPRDDCGLGVTVAADAASIACVTCWPPVTGLTGSCQAVRIKRFDARGAQIESFGGAPPPALSGAGLWAFARVVGASPRGALVVVRRGQDATLVEITRAGAIEALARAPRDQAYAIDRWRRQRPDVPLEEPRYPRGELTSTDDALCR
jgi:hypothetical protein